MPTTIIDSSLEMYYELDDFTDPWREAETVILQHGIGKNSKHWYAWPPLLARKYRVVRPDARGAGRSSVPPAGYSWFLSSFASDLHGLINHLGVDRVHLVGEVFGATVCLQFAYEYPERVRSVTVCGAPFSWVGDTGVSRMRRIALEKGTMAWAKAGSARRFGENPEARDFVDWYDREMARTNRRVLLELLDFLGTVDITAILPSIIAPTLILGGDESTIMPLDKNRQLQQLLPNARLVTFPSAPNHVYAAQPEKCVAELLRFLGEIKE